MELPLFPLHVVLFPGRPLPLHLFEQRYTQMLDDVLGTDRCFGVVAIRSGSEVGPGAEIYDVGTVAQIEHVTPLADDRYDIVTRGTERFRVLEMLHDTPYLRARVAPMPDPPHGPEDAEHGHRLRELLAPYLSCLGAPSELLERLPGCPDKLSYLAAAAMQVDLGDQQRLLELPNTSERLTATLDLLRRETRLMRHLGTVGSLRPAGPNGADLN